MANTRIKLIFGDERIIPASRLGVIGAMLGKSSFKKHCVRQKVNPKRSQPQIKNGDILLTYIGLLAQGKTAYEAVNEFDDDPDFYQNALGIAREIPSAETLCQRIDLIMEIISVAEYDNSAVTETDRSYRA